MFTCEILKIEELYEIIIELWAQDIIYWGFSVELFIPYTKALLHIRQKGSIQIKAAPTSHSPNFYDVPSSDPVTLCSNRRNALENN